MLSLLLSHVLVPVVWIMGTAALFVYSQVAISAVMLIPHLRKLKARRELSDTFLVLFAALCYLAMEVDAAVTGVFASGNAIREILWKVIGIIIGTVMIRHLSIKRCVYCVHLATMSRRKEATNEPRDRPPPVC